MILKSQRSQNRLNQRSVSPHENSLSRVLSYCPNNTTHRQSNIPSNAANKQTIQINLQNNRYKNNRIGNLFATKVSTLHSIEGYGSSKKNKNLQGGIRRLVIISLAMPRVFRTLLSSLDFLSLFTFMQTRRDYRWDVLSTRNKGY